MFNSGDDEALVEAFFTDDCSMTGGNREYHGKDELRAFLAWAHDGVREVMRPQAILRDDNLIFVEVDMDFHATRERSDFPFGHMYPGDLITVKFFVTYALRDGRVAELKSMTWPPERGVTKLPRLGSHPSQVAAFHAYASAFSNADFERFPTFYTEDVVLDLSSVGRIEGRQGIIDFYRPVFAKVQETLFIHRLEPGDDAIELEAVSRFTAMEDAPDFVVGALRKDEYIDVPVLVTYTLRDGLISHIGVRRGGEPVKHSRED